MAVTTRANTWWTDAVNLGGGLPADLTAPATAGSVLIAGASGIIGSEALATAMETLNTTLGNLNTTLTTLNGHLNDLKVLSQTTGHRTEGAYTSSTLPTLYKLLIEQGVILEDIGVLSESEQQRAAAAITDYIAKAKATFQPFE